jgi:YD repeat-containing protein
MKLRRSTISSNADFPFGRNSLPAFAFSISSTSRSSRSSREIKFNFLNANQRTAVTNSNSRWAYQYDSLGQVTSRRKYWTSDNAPVGGQNFEYSFYDIGNRKYSGSGEAAPGAPVWVVDPFHEQQ